MTLIGRYSEKGEYNSLSDCCNSKVTIDKTVCRDFSTNLSDYELGPVVGKSSFVSTFIYAGKYWKANKFVVIKKFDIDGMSVDEIEFLFREVKILNRLKHQHILSVLTSFVVGTEIVIICPLMEYRSCADIITKHFHTGLPEAVISIVLKDVLLALDFLHLKGVIHRAVKASHILISIEGFAKLSGFRYSCQNANCEIQFKSQRVFQFPPKSESNLKWLSPDILQQNCNGYDEKSDIYSLGVTLCELANGFVPYFDMQLSAMLLQKINGKTPLIYDISTLDKLQDTPDQELVNIFSNYFSSRQISKHLHGFKDLCFILNPKERPSAKRLLGHSLFSKTEKSRKSFCELIQPAIPITEKNFSCSADIQNLQPQSFQSCPNFNWEF